VHSHKVNMPKPNGADSTQVGDRQIGRAAGVGRITLSYHQQAIVES